MRPDCLSPNRRSRKLPIEQLERRTVLALITWGFDSGTLAFFGTPDADVLGAIRGHDPDGPGGPLPKTVWFKQNGAGGALVDRDTGVEAANVSSITISMFAGDDTVNLGAGMPGFDQFLELLAIDGGDNDDTIVSVPPGVVRLPTDPLSLRLDANITIKGGAGDENISGDDDPEVIEGEAGFDSILGDGGNDFIYGGLDWDWLLSGGDGDDRIEGGDGNDSIYGRADNDFIVGGLGDDWIEGNDGSDTIFGDEGNDRIWGGLGDDTIDTGTSGVEATAEYEDAPGGPWFEIVFGNDGFDGINAHSASGSAFLDGGPVGDDIYGSNYADTIKGQGGNDLLFGYGGNDLMSGGEGDDTIFSDNLWAGPDQPYGGNGPHPEWHDMMGTGEAGCNYVDEHEEGECPGSGGGGGAMMMVMGGESEDESCGCHSATNEVNASAGETRDMSSKLAEFLANHRMFELSPSGKWRIARPVRALANAPVAYRPEVVPAHRQEVELISLASGSPAAQESVELKSKPAESDDDADALLVGDLSQAQHAL